jgi:hypothetical protein
VHVRMMPQILAPGVQHRDEADLGAEMLLVGGDRAKRRCRGREEDALDDALVLQCDAREFLRHREHHVEVLDR